MGSGLPQPRIFISHSAKEPQAKALLRCLAKALRAAGFNPYIADLRMRRGDNFKKKLWDQLYTCHGAILILSPAALTSNWVNTEAGVLIVRHSKEGHKFPLLPVLIAGTTRDDVKNSDLGRLGLPDLHAPRVEASVVATEIADMLTELYGPPGPFHALEATIASMLSRLNDDAVELAAAVLNMDMTGWQPYGKREALAREMLRADSVGFWRVMNQIGSIVDDPIGMIDLVFPFTWIDERSAAPLAEAAQGASPRPSLAVNSKRAATGRWYVRRACPRPQSWQVADTIETGAESMDEALVGEVRRALLDVLCYEWGADVSDVELADALSRYEQQDGPIFVLVPPPADGVTVGTLRRHFPGLVFLVLMGEAAADQPLPGVVRMLMPLLDPKLEGDSHRDYQNLTRRFTRIGADHDSRRADG